MAGLGNQSGAIRSVQEDSHGVPGRLAGDADAVRDAFEQMPETQVTVRFVELAGVTELQLIHEPLPEISICLRIRTGWLGAWQRLKEVL